MKNYNDKWLERIGRRLADYEEPADDGLWKRIEQDLDAACCRRRARRLFRQRLLVAVAAAVVVGGLFFAIRLDNPTDNMLDPLSPAPAGRTAIVSGKLPDMPADNAVNSTVQTAQTTAREQSADRRIYATAIRTSADTRFAGKSRRTPKPVSADSSARRQTTPLFPENIVHDTHDDSQTTDTTWYAFGRQKAAETSHGRTIINASDLRTDNDAPKWDVAIAMSNNFSTDNASFGGFSPATSIPVRLFGAQPSAANREEAEFQNTYNYIQRNNIGQYTNTHVKHDFPVTYSASFRYRFTDRWAVNIGLSYTRLKSELTSGTTSNYYVTEQRLNFIGVPLSASYTFFDSRFVTLYALAGGSFEKCVSGKDETSLYTDYGSVSRRKKSDISHKPWQFSVMAGAGAQFNITRNYGIFAEPAAAYYFGDDQLDTYRSAHKVNFQLSVGLRLSY